MSFGYRKIHYAGGSNHREHPVTYIRFGDQIIFMGMTRGSSTINYAEEIICLIAKKEGVNPLVVTFFDLQTQQGYSNLQPGQFIINRLVCKYQGSKILVTDWQEGLLDPRVLRHFQGYISDDGLNTPLQNVSVHQGRFQPIQRCVI